MATCNECIYNSKCISRIVHLNGTDDLTGKDLPDMEKRCKDFKNKADFQEVKHGEWKRFGDNSKTCTCSNCNITQTVNVYNDKVMFEYCPYCGAKMDGVKNG